MKKAALVILLMTLPVLMRAGGPRLSFGLEWGYTSTFLKTSQHNFICEEGYRIIENPVSWRYLSNGAVLARAGADLTENINLSLYSGLLGVYSKRWIVPLELRMRWCPSGLYNEGILLQAGGGLGFPTSSLYETGARAVAGVGYRLPIYRTLSVDLILSWNFTLDSETILDPDTGDKVPRYRITSNSTEYQAFNLSIALNF